MNYEILHIVWTVLLVAIFVGIVVWAWNGKTKSRFDQAANLPFADEEAFNEYKDKLFQTKNRTMELKNE